jgi:glucose/arabinose dehydrogenase
MRRLLICAVLVLAAAVYIFMADRADVSKLDVPPGFHVAIFAETSSPRLLAFSSGGVLLATSMSSGTVVALPDPEHRGKAERVVTVLRGLDGPHGIAFHNGSLYIAERRALKRYDWNEAELKASNPRQLADLPDDLGGHATRTIVFANGKLYVSAGASCNVCTEDDPRRAAVMEFNEDGRDMRIFAAGTRNAVGLAFNPRTGTVWGTENGRDNLGDDLPPEEVNDYGKAGGDFGFPYCYTLKGKPVPDLSFGGNDARCAKTIPARVEILAHSAPLGLAFYDGTVFPRDYRGDLFVALHGSWNSSVLHGYKVVRIHFNDRGEPQSPEDFLSGFIRPGERRALRYRGRPVGIAVGPDGFLYVSDDSADLVYRITYSNR